MEQQETKDQQINNAPLLEKDEKPETLQTQRPRYFGIDLIRIFACFMVIHVHAGEYYYFGPGGDVMEGNGPFWNGIYNSQYRACVPLFVMISGYLLLPVKTDIPTFLKTRFTRILFPFFFWGIVFSFYSLALGEIDWKQALINIPMILVNYGCEVGHLWYIYMLIGVYLFAPIISPWIKVATIPQFIYYFVFWAITNTYVYIKLIFPEFWGEVFWNNTPMLQSFTGHFGYAVLGAFVKIHLDKHNLYWLGLILLISGYVITTVIWEIQWYRQCENAVTLELSWNFHSINVVMMTFGWFLLLRKIQCNNKYIVKFCQDIALKSYGMYLIHPMVLRGVHDLTVPKNGHPTIFIPLMSILAFFAAYLAVKIISFIPYSKYIIG
ncbi:transmembrane acyltransferase [Tritrichomonas foetus]|uniref:Transmembrane acyltransferase n=1 Tax=Tritrichomonas foetus TaxID=1144522 RepID=A0A1J4JS24_9EUKA|nr:transmembrane acyltransferase [Tritrichomonas foetus]|eukprot:OHT01554.1 transmembrane acyltransferase [Tritrichomonas foetus]